MRLIYRFLFTFLGLLVLTFGAKAQGEQSPEEEAKFYMETAKEILKSTNVLTQARDMYEFAANADPNSVEANFMTGNTYLQTTEKGKATKFLLKAYQLEPNYRFDILYLIGQAYQFGYEFEIALDYYNQYQQKLEDNTGYKGSNKTPLSVVERKIFECENGKRYKANPVGYSIVNLGNRVNSEFWDYAPVVNADETVMIYTTRRQEGNLNENVFNDNFYYEDIFISKKLDGEWQPATNIGNVVNTKYHDSNLGFSPDGKTLYIYSDEGNGDIYFTNLLSEDTWSLPESLSENINSSGYNEKSVSQSADGNTLFFASNRPGGNGGFDIYFSQKNKKGEWGSSKNLGNIINTDMDEDGCYLQFDGKTLYFSSTGHDGMGGFDIYKSVYDSAGGAWSTPENLGYPLNSPDDDIYFVMSKDGKTGYYASVRDDGMGYNDIYRVTVADASGGVKKSDISLKENSVEGDETKATTKVKDVTVKNVDDKMGKTASPVMLKVRVADDKTNSLINAKITLKRQKDNLVVPADNTKDGVSTFVISGDNAQNFMLSVQKEGYIFVNKKITIPVATAEEQVMRESILLRRPEVGSSKVLRNIYFDFGKATFSNGSYDELNKMVNFLNQNATINVEIAGHTDNVGNNQFNKKLSQQRANSVVAYLADKGIDRRRLTSNGYGEEKPLVSNDDETMGREINRRVEFIVKE
jgi:outer membrane protein OmpA-like peptidoglycan-associated protein